MTYKAPLRDINFVANELLNADAHYAALRGCEAAAADIRSAIFDSGAEFAEKVVAPLNHSGDQEGCHFDNGKVTTPKGFKEAFRQYGEGGWQALSIPVAEGGQGLPSSIGVAVGEMMGSANWAWSMYCGLSHAPVTVLLAAGTAAQKKFWLPKLLTLEWAGTMCLTEAHCGSDVGLLKTRAQKQADGSYKITGTKIFISSGEHDMASNIIHAVLARVSRRHGSVDRLWRRRFKGRRIKARRFKGRRWPRRPHRAIVRRGGRPHDPLAMAALAALDRRRDGGAPAQLVRRRRGRGAAGGIARGPGHRAAGALHRLRRRPRRGERG